MSDTTTSTKQEATRDGFGRALVELGRRDPRIVVVCADLAESTRAEWFKKEFPDRYVEVGVAEQNLATVASGLAAVGKIPFILSYAAFSPGRNNEQIRTTIALNQMPVIIAGCHAGLSVGPDGATHQALEDVGLMRMLPHMTVVSPADSIEAYKATLALGALGTPAYIRLGRAATPSCTTEEIPFEIGKAFVMRDVPEPLVTIVTTGNRLSTALSVFEKLASEVPMTVLHMPTIKPLDTNALLREAGRSGAIVTIEEHQVAGGMGSAVAEFLVQHAPVPMELVAVDDRFGQSGTPEELFAEYGIDEVGLEAAVRRIIERKK